MAGRPAIAVFDVGKSNVKLALVDEASRSVVATRTTPNIVRTGGPYPHFDVDRLWDWLIDGLHAFSADVAISAIATTTHGACFALTTDDGLALPILDYEFSGPDSASDYDAARGAFAETLSPSLPGGLNAGRQFFWQSRSFPEAFARTRAVLPYPQYWAWRLSGAKVAEATSLGAHTDLWDPRGRTFSVLAVREGWDALFPDRVAPWTTIGRVLPAIAAEAGLRADCRVLAGIHDSNAALLPHILARPLPFAVISTGTWMITFAAGGSLDGLDGARDCLANVDAFTRPVPSTMSMGGREFEILTGGTSAEPSADELARVVAERVMALPSFAPGSGPFPKSKGRWSGDPDRLSPGERVAAASLYLALIADTCLGLAGADGPIAIEGPFSRNRVFLAALARLTGRAVVARPDAAGTTLGAALLAFGPDAAFDLADPPPVAALDIDLSHYAKAWRQSAERRA